MKAFALTETDLFILPLILSLFPSISLSFYPFFIPSLLHSLFCSIFHCILFSLSPYFILLLFHSNPFYSIPLLLYLFPSAPISFSLYFILFSFFHSLSPSHSTPLSFYPSFIVSLSLYLYFILSPSLSLWSPLLSFFLTLAFFHSIPIPFYPSFIASILFYFSFTVSLLFCPSSVLYILSSLFQLLLIQLASFELHIWQFCFSWSTQSEQNLTTCIKSEYRWS